MRPSLKGLLVSALVGGAIVAPALGEADELERSVALMAKIGSATSPSFSPDGKTIAFVTNLGGLPQVWTVPAAGGYPQLRHGLRRSGRLRELVARRRLARLHASRPAAGMNAQVYLVRPDGTGVRRLTDGGKENNRLRRLGPTTARGSSLARTAASRGAIDAYVVRPRPREARAWSSENRGIGGIDGRQRATEARAPEPRA